MPRHPSGAIALYIQALSGLSAVLVAAAVGAGILLGRFG
jgi:hypothetical protein